MTSADETTKPESDAEAFPEPTMLGTASKRARKMMRWVVYISLGLMVGGLCLLFTCTFAESLDASVRRLAMGALVMGMFAPFMAGAVTGHLQSRDET